MSQNYTPEFKKKIVRLHETMNMNFNFNNPTNLIFGSGSLNQLGEEIAKRKAKGFLGGKALLLISNGKSTK